MSIWFTAPDIAALQHLGKGNMGEHLGMEFTSVTENSLHAKMPVDERTKQPYGLLHGGASAALAETLGSIASALVIDPNKFMAVGLEINANHVRGVRNGYVHAHCTPLHIGASTHVWDIKIYDDREKLVCISRLTVAIIKRSDKQ
jgi:1,4-dihydroxy-2-naphthoyl-CoA hydrolase